MRLFGGLGVLVPAAIGASILAVLVVAGTTIDEPSRLLLAAIAAGTTGMAVAFVLAALIVQVRVGRLVRAAERIAAGDLEVRVGTGGSGLTGRLGCALASITTALRETTESATVDKLTGVSNRQALLGTLFAEVERAARYNRPFSVAFVDIDHFKNVNDTYGHAVGDVVLRGVAQTLRANLRATDTIGRYGGEEFMLLLTETDPEDATQLTEKLRNLVARQRFAVDGNPNLAVTISIGIAGGVGAALRVDALVRDADAAMYSAKSLGRNQTYVFSEPDEDARVPRAPISPAGRSKAVEIGRIARDAAVASLAAIIAPMAHHRGRPSAVMTEIVGAMATQLDLPEPEVDRLRIAALLHDLGKVAVPEDILEKQSPLTSAEWRTVVQHPRIAQVILEQASAIRDAAPIVLHHHERYSGHGYPFGLRGNDIPLGARIVAIADAYDAMTNDRPHKPALAHDAALRELRRHAGTQFDPDLVSLFCDLYADAPPVPDATVAAMTAAGAAAASRLATIHAHDEVVDEADPEPALEVPLELPEWATRRRLEEPQPEPDEPPVSLPRDPAPSRPRGSRRARIAPTDPGPSVDDEPTPRRRGDARSAAS